MTHQGIFIPALIAAAIYLVLAYAILPFARAHRQRYSQYLPLDTLADRTSSLRARAGSAIGRILLPASMRWSREVIDASGRRNSEDVFGEEEGESMVGFDVERRDREVRGGRVEMDSQRRLSRDLEEGFKDDSEEEEVEGHDSADHVFHEQRR